MKYWEIIASADSGLQLDLEIALSGVPAKVPKGIAFPEWINHHTLPGN